MFADSSTGFQALLLSATSVSPFIDVETGEEVRSTGSPDASYSKGSGSRDWEGDETFDPGSGELEVTCEEAGGSQEHQLSLGNYTKFTPFSDSMSPHHCLFLSLSQQQKYWTGHVWQPGNAAQRERDQLRHRIHVNTAEHCWCGCRAVFTV